MRLNVGISCFYRSLKGRWLEKSLLVSHCMSTCCLYTLDILQNCCGPCDATLNLRWFHWKMHHYHGIKSLMYAWSWHPNVGLPITVARMLEAHNCLEYPSVQLHYNFPSLELEQDMLCQGCNVVMKGLTERLWAFPAQHQSLILLMYCVWMDKFPWASSKI